MTTKPKRWSDMVAAMPKLTEEQSKAVLDIVDYHLSGLVSDHPPVDDAHWEIQRDVKVLVEAPLPAGPVWVRSEHKRPKKGSRVLGRWVDGLGENIIDEVDFDKHGEWVNPKDPCEDWAEPASWAAISGKPVSKETT